MSQASLVARATRQPEGYAGFVLTPRGVALRISPEYYATAEQALAWARAMVVTLSKPQEPERIPTTPIQRTRATLAWAIRFVTSQTPRVHKYSAASLLQALDLGALAYGVIRDVTRLNAAFR